MGWNLFELLALIDVCVFAGKGGGTLKQPRSFILLVNQWATQWNFHYLIFLPPANEVWGKVMFLHLSVSHSVHKEGGWWPIACWDTFPRVDTPLGRHPLTRTYTLLWADTHLYASYWNAYLLFCRFIYFRKAWLINLHTCNMQQIYRTNRSLMREICLEIIRTTSKSRTINGWNENYLRFRPSNQMSFFYWK